MIEKPPERPQTLDPKGRHILPMPAMVKGKFRTWRNRTNFILVFFFLVLPWTTMNGVQTVLIDIPKRQFSFFGITFWGHEMPIVFFVLALLTLGLAFLTSVLGRAWCGWACPQTVFIDAVFRRIEIWVEGSHIARKKLAAAPWSFSKFLKKFMKWVIFIFIGLIISHSLIAYFVGAQDLLQMLRQSPSENWTPFVLVFSIGLVLAGNFGWFREQFCLIMCPYGRIQSVLMDDHSKTILYDEKRGEPRGALRKNLQDQNNLGDCIDCKKCIAVCPTGIDIRRGLQLECIACTACADACDEVMTKIKRPRGLIRYSSESELRGQKSSFFRPRVAIYLVLLSVFAIGLTMLLALRKPLDITILRATDAPYTVTGDVLINHFKLKIQNQSFTAKKIQLLSPNKIINGEQEIELVTPQVHFLLEPKERKDVHFFLKLDRNSEGFFLKSPLDVPIQIFSRDFSNNPVDSNSSREVHSKVFKESVRVIGPFE